MQWHYIVLNTTGTLKKMLHTPEVVVIEIRWQRKKRKRRPIVKKYKYSVYKIKMHGQKPNIMYTYMRYYLNPTLFAWHIGLQKRLAGPPSDWPTYWPTVHRTYEWLTTPIINNIYIGAKQWIEHQWWLAIKVSHHLPKKWLCRPLSWSLKYGQSSQPDAGTVHKGILRTSRHKRPDRQRKTKHYELGRIHDKISCSILETGRLAHSE